MRRLRVLIVDDEKVIADLLQDELAEEGCVTLVATDGAEALDILGRELLDAVILDISMPKVNGYDVLRRLREFSNIPVIMASTLNTEEDKAKCQELGANDYITKPFVVEEFVTRFKAVLGLTAQPEGMADKPLEAPTCSTCSELVVSSPEGCRCRHGRFDRRNPRWFAQSGIAGPNKTVARAQRD